MTETKRVIKGIFFKSISNVIVIILGLATSVVLNRYFGKDNYGLLVMVFTITGLVNSFSGLGSIPTMNRFIPSFVKEKKQSDIFDLVFTCFLYQLLGLIVFAGAAFFMSDFIARNFFGKAQISPLLKIGAVYSATFCLVNFGFEALQALQSWKRESLLNVIYPLVYLALILVFLFILKINNLSSVLAANILSAVLVIGLAFIYIFREIKLRTLISINLRKIFENSKRINSFGMPLLLNDINFFIVMWFDKLILGRYGKTADLTFYYIAFTFVNGLIILFKVLTAVLMPYAAGISQVDPVAIEKKFRLIFRWFMHIAVIVSISTFFLIKPIIAVLYGNNYSPVVLVFRLLLLVFLLRALLNVYGMFLVNVFSKTKHSAALGTCLSIATILLNFALIPKYGFIGAAIGGILAHCFYWLCILVALKSIRDIIPYRDILKTSIILIIMAAANYLLGYLGFSDAYFLTVFNLVFYVLLLKVFHEIEIRDIELLKEIKSTLKSANSLLA